MVEHMLNDTLKVIEGDTSDIKPTWPDILTMLNMTQCSFPDADEEHKAYQFMVDYIEKQGEDWIKDNSGRVVYEWEQIKKQHRNEARGQRRKKKLKRRGLLAKILY